MSSLADWIRLARSSASGANRFALARLAGVEAQPWGGRKARFLRSHVVQVKALACELSHTFGLPLSRFSIEEIRRHVISQGLVAEISGATLWRWISSDNDLRPWQSRSWMFPRDPKFADQAGPMLDLYQRVWEGTPPGPDNGFVCLRSVLRAIHLIASHVTMCAIL